MKFTYVVIKRYEDKVIKLSEPTPFREAYRLYQNFVDHGMEHVLIVPSDQIPFLELQDL